MSKTPFQPEQNEDRHAAGSLLTPPTLDQLQWESRFRNRPT